MYVAFLYSFFFLIIYLFFDNRKNFYNFFQEFPKKALVLSFLIFCLAFFIREFIIPHMHHVYYDEFYYINIAKNLYHHNILGCTILGDEFNLEMAEKSMRPGGYSFLLNLVFRIFGNSFGTVFQMSVFLGALSVVTIFWIGYLLFNNIGVGLWGAIVFNFLPPHLKYSGSGSSDIASLFFVLLSILIVLISLKLRKRPLFYLALSLNIFSCYIRPGNIILLFLLTALLISEYKKGDFGRKELIPLISIFLLLLIPLILQISSMINIEQINAKNSFLSINNLSNNFLPNLQYLFSHRFYSLISTIFFLAGSIYLFSRKRKLWFLLSGWFLLFYLIYSAYFMGRFSLLFTADSDRHFFLSAIPFSILAGYGIYSLLLKAKPRKLLLIFLILISLIINSFYATKNIISYTFNRDVYKETLFLKEAKNKLPKDLYMLCYNPGYIINITGKKVIRFSNFDSMVDHPQKLILFKGFWWHQEESSSYYEDILKKLYNFEIIAEEQIGRNKSGFYLLTHK